MTPLPTRPALRYYGGKWALAPWIISFFPRHRQYVEPFGGAGSVLMQKQRACGEVYNDLNGDVVNVFRVLQDRAMATELHKRCALTPFARAEFNLAMEPTDDHVERARRVIVRAYMGFGSAGGQMRSTGFRYNSNRSGTTPATDWARWPAQIPRYVERLQGVVIEQKPALEVIRNHDHPGTLYYVDPPYVQSARQDRQNGKPRGRYRCEMTDADHHELAEALRCVEGMVVLSGYPCDLYDELYPSPTWERHEISAHADNGGAPYIGGEQTRRTEVVWLNEACATALNRERHQLLLSLEESA